MFPNEGTLSGSTSGTANGLIIGQAGGMSTGWVAADASLTRPANTTAYATNGALGSSGATLFKWTGLFRKKGSSGLLVGMRLSASVASIATSNMGGVRAHMWNAQPATLPAADQSTFNLLVADNGAAKLGTVDFSAWNTGGGSSDMIESFGSPALTPLPLIAGAAAQELFVVFVATGAFTPIASSILTPFVNVVLD